MAFLSGLFAGPAQRASTYYRRGMSWRPSMHRRPPPPSRPLTSMGSATCCSRPYACSLGTSYQGISLHFLRAQLRATGEAGRGGAPPPFAHGRPPPFPRALPDLIRALHVSSSSLRWPTGGQLLDGHTGAKPGRLAGGKSTYSGTRTLRTSNPSPSLAISLGWHTECKPGASPLSPTATLLPRRRERPAAPYYIPVLWQGTPPHCCRPRAPTLLPRPSRASKGRDTSLFSLDRAGLAVSAQLVSIAPLALH